MSKQSAPTQPLVSAVELARILGQAHPPTPQQQKVIEAPPEPLLVVAGAGAGKTETMAARVVWLVANKFVRPDQVLGLTFTKKAAQQLSRRIRSRLGALAESPRLKDIDPDGSLAAELSVIAPTISTYDSYASRLVAEYGLLAAVETGARVISAAEQFNLAMEVVTNADSVAGLPEVSQPVLAERILALAAEVDNHMVSIEKLVEETEPLVRTIKDIAGEKALTQAVQKIINTQTHRVNLMHLVRQYRSLVKERSAVTFGEQMSTAAWLAQHQPRVAESERRRYTVVMLDEYQDTSHSQRVLLRSLFGGNNPPVAVTAVGDPMQSIYGWRGATAANLVRFREDFPINRPHQHRRPARKAVLTTSWRNPDTVLAAANVVADKELGRSGNRLVPPLQPRPGAGQGAVQLGRFASWEEEIAAVADHMAGHFHRRAELNSTRAKEDQQPFSGAILVRKAAHIPELVQALEQREVPVEVVGMQGLLGIPEVADVRATLTMLVRPADNSAAVRILGGPLVNLGIADLRALARRARTLSRHVSAVEPEAAAAAPHGEAAAGAGEEEPEFLRFVQQVNSVSPVAPEAVVGLTDALADLGEPEQYSPEGYRRLTDVAARLRYLRRHALRSSLVDVVMEIQRVMGVRTEVLARGSRGVVNTGTTHLDAFARAVAAYADTPGATAQGLVDYLTVAQEREKGLSPGEVTTTGDRVQVLTVHKSKGLEWEHVAVVHADNSTYIDSRSKRGDYPNWLTNAAVLPTTVRGDAAEDPGQGDASGDGAPVLDISQAESLAQVNALAKEHQKQLRAIVEAETSRLFYVALTRAEESVLVTASAANEQGKPLSAYWGLERLRDRVEGAETLCWAEDAAGATAGDIAPVTAVYPQDFLGSRRAGVEHAATLVEQGINGRLPRRVRGELEDIWEAEVGALIEEHRAAQKPVAVVRLGRELTTSDVVSLKRDEEQLARRLRRPIPLRPTAYAKRGTEFHQWLEEHFRSNSLVDVPAGEALLGDPSGGPEASEASAEDRLEQLRRQFLAGQWADRVPQFIEQPFEVAVGSALVRGRIDAVFSLRSSPQAPPQWWVVDWKTGRKPTGDELQAAAIQLAVYRYAWAELLSSQGEDPVAARDVRAAFYYVGEDYTYEPQQLPDPEELARLLASAGTA